MNGIYSVAQSTDGGQKDAFFQGQLSILFPTQTPPEHIRTPELPDHLTSLHP